MVKCYMCGVEIERTVKPSSTTPVIALCDECIKKVFLYLRKLRGEEEWEE